MSYRLFFICLKKNIYFGNYKIDEPHGWCQEPVRPRREPSECSRLAPPSGDIARCSQEWSSSLLLLPLAEVTLVVEVAEEDDERDAVAKHKDVHGIGEVALGEQVVARVEEEEQELHLVRGRRFLCRSTARLLDCSTGCWRRRRLPAAGTWGISSTTGTSACVGRWLPGRSTSTWRCGRRCWPGR